MRTSIWKGSISFGLLNIPVSLQTAVQEKELHFSMLDKKDLSRITYKKFNATTEKEVPCERITKGYEYEKGHFVVLSDAELKKANIRATQTIDIEDFVLYEEIDPLLFEKPYYAIPQKGAEKGYYLLCEALKKSHKVAIAKIVIRIKQRLAMLMPQNNCLVLEILRFNHEIRRPDQPDSKVQPSKMRIHPQEMKMAEELIAGMTSPWKPERYKDTYFDDVMRSINQKIRSGKIQEVATPSKEERIRPTHNGEDIMNLLKKSLATRGRTSRSRKTKKDSSRALH